MALQGTIPNPFKINEGIETAYAKITGLEFNYLAKQAMIYVSVFYSQEDRDGDHPALPIRRESYSLGGSTFDSYFTDTAIRPQNVTDLSQAYTYLKTLPEWQGWVDC